MFLVFIILGLKIHSYFDDMGQEMKKDVPEIDKYANYAKTKDNKNRVSKKKKIGRYKCDTIKFLNSSEQKFHEINTEQVQFINCSNKNYIKNRNNVEIERTIIKSTGKHINDQNLNALIIIKNADFNCTSSQFKSSSSTNNDAQLIHFLGKGIHTITNTDFKFCGKNPYINKKHILEEFDPSLIVFDDLSKNFINGGQFCHTKNETEQLFDIFPTRCIRTKKKCSLIVRGTYFYNATSYHGGSFFLVDSNENTSIIDSYFEACYDHGNSVHAIFANQGFVDIKNCKFNNILMKPTSTGSIIRSETITFNFEGNNVKFDNPTINCRCIYISNSGIYNISRNKFNNIEINQNSSAIYIENPSDITFDNNEFNKLIGTGTGHALLLTFDTLEDKPLIGNKFQNINSSNGLIFIRSIDDIETNYTFEGLRLENIQQNGGAIINVENINNIYYGLELINCIFGSNNNTDGGALLINDETFPKCVALFMINCNFMFNEASGKGGAIAITSDIDIVIISITGNGSNFNLNKANQGGGAIYIQPSSNSIERKCTIIGVNFNRNYGKDSHSIWIDVSSFDDNFILELLDGIYFADDNGHYYQTPSDSGASCLCNCKSIKIDRCNFKSNDGVQLCGGINVTAKSILEVSRTDFLRCNAGSSEGSYGGCIGYSYRKTDELDQAREESIIITDCTFEDGKGQNGVALFLNMLTMNANITNVKIMNHIETSYIFCIFFECESDNEIFTLKNAEFSRNQYNSNLHGDDCGGSGILISKSNTQDQFKSLTVQFEDCHFLNNHSPNNGGAIGYDSNNNLKTVDLIFNRCEFKNNTCAKSGGACHFATEKTIEIYNCNFDDNVCQGDADASGGGAINLHSSIEMIIIDGCTFSNCSAAKGSIICTNGGVKGVNISHCTFTNISDNQYSSFYLDVDSSATIFIFEYNDFKDLEFIGEYGGSGIHIGTGRDCEISFCTFSGNKGEGQIIIPDNSNHKLIFNKCEFEQGNGGSRSIYIKGESCIEFTTCHFQNFNDINDPTGRGLLVYTIAEQKNPLFYNCVFENVVCVSAFDFENCLTIQMNECNFTVVQAKLTGKGAFIYMKKANHISITNCNFDQCGSPDKTIDKPCIGLCESVETAEIINCSFIKCGRNGNGAAISTKNVTDILIHNCIFRENIATGTSGDTLSVFIGTGSTNCEISNCHVSTRRSSRIENIYQFGVYSENVIFVNNLFDKFNENDYNLADKGFGGISFNRIDSLTIANNTFETRNAAVYATNIKNIDIYNNTWQNLYGANPAGPPRGLYISTTLNSLILRNNTFARCPNVANRIMVFDSNEIIIEDCIFIENNFQKDRWGGIGMTFDRTNFKVIFRNCVFRDNEGIVGGSIQFGGPISPNPNSGSIELYSCRFEGNKASDTGGALSFTSKGNNIVQNCIFNDNIAGKNGGAVSVIPVQESGDYGDANEESSINSIINCQFNSNIASPTGHSLFIMNKGKSIVEGCTFVNEKPERNGGMLSCQRSGFSSEFGLVEVHNTTFKSIGSDAKVCGIDVFTEGISIIYDCIFNGFQQSSSSEGNAIRLRNNGILNDISDNTFNNCGKDGYIVFCSGDGIDFYRNKFVFDNFSESCGCIKIYCGSSSQNIHHYIFENNFHDCQVDSGRGYGILYYYCDQSGEAKFQSNTFENLKGFIAAFDITVSISVVITFNNNTILNNIPGRHYQYLCSFSFKGTYTAQSTFTISNTKFINNECKSPCGGGIGIWFSNNGKIFNFQFENCTFEQNHAIYELISYENGKGGAIEIGNSPKTRMVNPSFINCQFNYNRAENEGGALSLNIEGSISIENCSFYKNEAGVNGTIIYGGAINTYSSNEINIRSCLFVENIANYYSNPSSDLLNDKGRGGAIKSTSSNLLIEDCLFKSNEAYYGYAIYIEGDDNQTEIEINNNSFIDNFDKETYHRASSVIDIQRCDNINEDILDNNFFSNQKDGRKIYVRNINCFENKATNYFTESSVFIDSNYFTESSIFSVSNYFTESSIFSVSNYFTESSIFTETKTYQISDVSKKISISKSFSISYTYMKSVSFSLSYVSSNTYDISYDSIKETYIMISTQTDVLNYYPYIIHYLSPMYIEQNIIIEIINKKTISPEQLIGICCGSACVFFLVLGIIILAIRKHNEVINEYNEFDDISYSSEEKSKGIEKEKSQNDNVNEINNLNSNDEVNAASESDLNFWI